MVKNVWEKLWELTSWMVWGALSLIAVIACDTKTAGITVTTSNGTIAATLIENSETELPDSIPKFAHLYKAGNAEIFDSLDIKDTSLILFDSLSPGEYEISIVYADKEVAHQSAIMVDDNLITSVTINITITINIYQTIINNYATPADAVKGGGSSMADAHTSAAFVSSGEIDASLSVGEVSVSSSSPSAELVLSSSSFVNLSSKLVSSSSSLVNLSSKSVSSSSSLVNLSSESVSSSSSIENPSSDISLSSSSSIDHISSFSSIDQISSSSLNLVPLSSSVLVKESLSNLQASIVASDHDYYDLYVNETRNGNALKLNNVEYSNGLWVYSGSLVTFDLNKEWDWFEVDVGVDDVGRDHDPKFSVHSAVYFKVSTNDTGRYVSPLMRFHSNTQRVRVNVTGVNYLTLEVDKESGAQYNYSIWANPVVWKGDSSAYVNPYLIPQSTEPYDFYNETVVDGPNVGMNWSSCIMYKVDSLSYVGCHKENTGSVLVRKIKQDLSASDFVASITLDSTWTNIEPVRIRDTTMLFFYDALDGGYAIYTLNENGTPGTIVLSGLMHDQMSDFTFYTVGNQYYVMMTSKATGRLSIYPLSDDGVPGVAVVDSLSLECWSYAQSYEAGGNSYMLLSNAESNSQTTYAIGNDGSLGTVISVNQFEQGWTIVKPYYTNGATYLFLYNESNGNVQNYRLESDGTIGGVNYYSDWSGGWTNADIMEIDGVSVRFIYKKGSGRSELAYNIIDVVAP